MPTEVAISDEFVAEILPTFEEVDVPSTSEGNLQKRVTNYLTPDATAEAWSQHDSPGAAMHTMHTHAAAHPTVGSHPSMLPSHIHSPAHLPAHARDAKSRAVTQDRPITRRRAYRTVSQHYTGVEDYEASDSDAAPAATGDPPNACVHKSKLQGHDVPDILFRKNRGVSQWMSHSRPTVWDAADSNDMQCPVHVTVLHSNQVAAHTIPVQTPSPVNARTVDYHAMPMPSS